MTPGLSPELTPEAAPELTPEAAPEPASVSGIRPGSTPSQGAPNRTSAPERRVSSTRCRMSPAVSVAMKK